MSTKDYKMLHEAYNGMCEHSSDLADRLYRITELVRQYGCIDGAHHKQWVLDQIVRAAYGMKMGEAPNEKYKEWVKEVLGEMDENGEYEYWYDYGVPP